MPLDSELALWTIRPNWADGILERLNWLTDVIAGDYGNEQARALRLSPRRQFEMTFNPIDDARSYFELWLHRFGSDEFMVPLFHDRGRLSAPIVAGATAIPVDTRWREFTVGGMAVLIGEDCFTYDKVEITAIADAELTVAVGGVTRDWGKGVGIYPLRRTRLEQESVVSALTSRVGQGSLRFELNQANDLADEGEWDSLFGDYPILLTKPNRREVIDLTFQRNSLVLDNEQGLTELGDAAGRAFTLQTYMRMMHGRQAHHEFRQFLYRLRGRQSGVWLPTYNRDFVLSQPALVADAKLDVKKIGYEATGGAVSGRTVVLVNGETPAIITGTGAAPSTAEERLNLSGAIGIAYPAGTIGCFMDTCALAGDDVEIVHHTDTDGVAECQLAFRAFRDEREPPVVLAHAIPAGVESEESCGTPADSCEDIIGPEEGFWFQIHFDWAQGAQSPKNAPSLLTYYDIDGVQQGYLFKLGGYTEDTWDGDNLVYTTLTCWDEVVGPAEHGVLGWNDYLGGALPDQIRLLVQFPSGSFDGSNIINPGHGLASAWFQQPGGPMIPLLVTAAEVGDTGGFTFKTTNLWPRDYTVVPVP